MAIAVDFMAASEWGWLDDWPEVDTSILRDLSFIGGEARFGALPCICPLAGRTYRVLARQGETIEGSRTMRNRPYPVLKAGCEL